MARVVVYERSVNAIIIDSTFATELQQKGLGLKIKEEPDEPPEASEKSARASLSKNNVTPTLSDVHDPTQTEGKETIRDSLKKDKQYESRKAEENSDGHQILIQKEPRSRKHRLSDDMADVKLRPRKKLRMDADGISCHDSDNDPRSNDDSEMEKLKKRRIKRIPGYYKGQHCSSCFITFESKRALKCHVAIYARCRSYRCGYCMTTFNKQDIFLPHIAKCQLTNSPQGYLCYFCGHSCRKKASLQSHIFHHHQKEMNAFPRSLSHPTAEPNVSLEKSTLTSPVNSPTKKLRQTTLTEFLKTPTNKPTDVERSHQKDPKLEGSNTPQVAAKNNEVSKSTGVPTPTNASQKPFVQIPMNCDLMLDLLKDVPPIKPEPMDMEISVTPVLPNTSRSSSYSLRRSVGTPASCTPARGESPYTRMKRRKSRTESNPSSHKHVKQVPKLKECSVRLVRCDDQFKKKPDPHADSVTHPVITWQKIPTSNKPRHSAPSILESTVKCVSALKDVQVSLVRVQDLDKVCNNSGLTPQMTRNVESIKCKVCRKTFSSKENVREHMNLFHTVYMSSICGARFSLRSLLLDHYLRQHTPFRKNECCVCSERFRTSLLLKEHLVLHCIKTRRSKKDQFSVDADMKCNVYKKKYKCATCNKRFWLNDCCKKHEDICGRKVKVEKEENKLPTVSPSSEDVISQAPQEPVIPSENVILPSSEEHLHAEAPSLPTFPLDTHPSPVVADFELPAPIETFLNTGDILNAGKVRYPCPVCGKKFRTFRTLCKHQATYSQPAKYCGVCGTGFTSRKQYRTHRITTHILKSAQNFTLRCRFCNQGFAKEDRLRSHELHFHTDEVEEASEDVTLDREQLSNINTVCNVCNLMFETYDRFVEHNMYYYKGHVFSCTFCKQTFSGMYMLHHHNKLVHYPDQARKCYVFVCDICNEGFNHESHFHAHKLHVHISESLIGLSHDNSAREMNDHNYSIMPSTDLSNVGLAKPMEAPAIGNMCDICNINFALEKDLIAHKKEYLVDGDFPCDVCNRKCGTASVLKKHQVLNHSGAAMDCAYKCRFCSEIVTTSIALVSHEKHFHSEELTKITEFESEGVFSIVNDTTSAREACDDTTDNDGVINHNSFRCATCGMRFTHTDDLENHLLEYSDSGDHACDICGRKFRDTERLEAHRVKHTILNSALSDHHCPICLEGFTSATYVRIHLLHFHGYETFRDAFTKRTDRSKKKDSSHPKSLSTEQTTAPKHAEFPAQVTSTNDSVSGKASHASSTPLASSSKQSAPQTGGDKTEKAQVFECKMCYMKFQSEKNLTKHKQRYVNTGDYICEVCGQRFAWESILKEHQSQHTTDGNEVLKYCCQHCGDTFRSTKAVVSHTVHVHNNMEEKGDTDKPQVDATDYLFQELIVHDNPVCDTTTSDQKPYMTIEKSENQSTIQQLTTLVPSASQNKDVAAEDSSFFVMDSEPCANGTENKDVEEVCSSPADGKKVSKPINDELPAKKKLTYTCPVCMTDYASLKYLKKHFQVVHKSVLIARLDDAKSASSSTPMEMLICMICESSFDDKLALHRHMLDCHKLEPSVALAMKPPRVLSLVRINKLDLTKKKNVLIALKPPRSSETKSPKPAKNKTVVKQPTKQKPNEAPSSLGDRSANVGKLKVKSFAKFVEFPSENNISSSTDVGEQFDLFNDATDPN